MKQVVGAVLLLITTALIACPQEAVAPRQPIDSTHVFTYVERMPQMLEGGGMSGIVGKFQKRFRLPSFTDNENIRYSGIHVTFVVGTDGQVRNATISKSSNNTSIDTAVLVAARSLPRLNPGYHDGRAVPVQLTIPVNCIKPEF